MGTSMRTVTEDQRSFLARDQGSGFMMIERCVAQFLSYGLGQMTAERDHYCFATLLARDDGLLEFEGLGLKALAKVEYTKRDGGWIARYVFHLIETSLLGESAIGDPVYAVEINSEGFVRIGDDTNQFNLFPQVPGMFVGAIYNRLKQSLLCVAENQHDE